MGGFMSIPNTSAMERSEEIDRQIEEDSKHFKRKCRVLVLGLSGSGKTTVIRQMVLSAPNEYSMFVSAIHRDVFDSAYQLVEYMKRTGLECADDWNRLLAEKIHKHILPTPEPDYAPILAPEIAQAIHKLWMDPIIRKVMAERRSDLCLMDSASYFFDEILRIASPGYLPNEADVLRLRSGKAVGIEETRIIVGGLSLTLLEVGGQRNEQRKWIHCFEGVTSIMYCVALDQYSQSLSEDKTQNQMNESLLLFESVVNSRWFLRTSIILLLNKVDIFKDTLNQDPLERYFPEYTGGNDLNKAAKYILWKFMQANRARLSVYPHLGRATDPGNLRLVLSAVKETILQNALKDREIL